MTTATTNQAADPLQKHIVTLRAELAAMEAKRDRLATAITMKRKSLSRLEAESAMRGHAAPARPRHE